jgi:polysaccharide export outer membrane protein
VLLQPGYLLDVQIEGAVVSRVIDPAGDFSIPYVGHVPAAGKTPRELEEFLEQALIERGLLASPSVTVQLVSPPVYVVGEVNSPGAYEYPSHLETLTVSAAVALAAGWTARAAKNNVVIERNSRRHQAQLMDQVLPGDVIYVCEWFTLKQRSRNDACQ